ncbi:GSU2403 family nucleotidyltransferase fold protein [Pelagerythrobacter sp.]|uniref:GSU2403 family nucleotidyltransferase fold protein n=1 Tax=Pelagerythrobacter sp. TaxID=2800702 RepID=UPI0035AE54E0
MADRVRPFTDEQARALINLRPRYESLIEAERALARLPYNLVRKRVGEREYLYEAIDRANNGKSLGPMTPEHEERLAEYRATKADLQDRAAIAGGMVEEIGRLARPLRLPTLASAAGELLRELDRSGLLDGTLLVVGTNCIPAFSVEASGAIADAPDETDDFDLAWTAEEEAEDAALWNALKAVDPTFTLNSEREFQARNRKSYEVELLVAPSRAATMSAREKPRPIPLPEQEWLLLGKPVDQVVPCRDGSAARLVVPDPRWFALHKLWLGNQAKRDPLKRRKDIRQGNAVLDAVAEAMPHYPLDAAFADAIPDELRPYWRAWRDTQPDTKG